MALSESFNQANSMNSMAENKLTSEQQTKLREKALRYGINAANAKAILALVLEALRNPASYPVLRKKAAMMGFTNLPEEFNKQFLQSVLLLANSAQ